MKKGRVIFKHRGRIQGHQNQIRANYLIRKIVQNLFRSRAKIESIKGALVKQERFQKEHSAWNGFM